VEARQEEEIKKRVPSLFGRDSVWVSCF